ncbi:hypothetical protein EGW08_022928 [Elysia chlorotica]|uniref:Xyloside xylosyltransferase 1 n=1 Tax=Elysia chlorotica TaxID=188477 RepID=A0A3S1GZN1_ELYCH|nr:hypothetical protein EGW08_022928 [Elysia chlorotica]
MVWKRKSFQNVIVVVIISLLLVALMHILHSKFKMSSKIQSQNESEFLSRNDAAINQSLPNVKRKQDYSCQNIESIPFRHTGELHLMFIFHNAEPHGTLQRNFLRCVDSIFDKTSKPFAKITCHIIGDLKSFQVAKDVFRELRLYNLVKLEHHSNTALAEKARLLLAPLLQGLSVRRHHFSDPLFFISTVLHRLLPRNISRLILLDIDLVFKADVAGLLSLFDRFTGAQVVGIARENQPVYRHVFSEYRQRHQGTKIGEPPPNGITGVNSGVLLLDLDKLRCSEAYNSMFQPGLVPGLVRNYSMSANLGDQDFYTLVQLARPELLYLLPCGWNRQLCQWWRMDHLQEVFDLFYACPEPISVFHGNCKANLSSVS